MTPQILTECAGSPLALKKIEYLFVADAADLALDTIVGPGWQRAEAVMPTGSVWQELPTLPFPRWTESTSNSGQGEVYQNQITAQVPQLSVANSAAMDALSRNRLILRLTDLKNTVYVLGSHLEGLKLSYQRTAGGAGSFAGYLVTVSGALSHSAAR